MPNRVLNIAQIPRGGGLTSSLALVRPWPWRLGFACIGTALAGLLSLLPYGTAWLLCGWQNALMDGSGKLGYSGIWVLHHALACWSKIIAHSLAFTALAQLKQALLDKLDRVALSHFDQVQPAQHVQLIGEQTDALEDAVAHLLPDCQR